MMKNEKKYYNDPELEIINVSLGNVITGSNDPEPEEQETPKMPIVL